MTQIRLFILINAIITSIMAVSLKKQPIAQMP
jgi:hypothetical protein